MKGIEGLTLGRYELRRRVAQGGMAEVYLGYDRRVKRQVAVKVLYGRDDSFVRRFEREALSVGALSHNHILPLYDFGEQRLWYYLVMPYISGGTLRDHLLKRKRLSLEEAASFIGQIASALQHAHDHGVVHRDVKPSNILLRPDGYAYLVDFGLAKAIMSTDFLTRDGALVGTPEYMAPEQSNGINDYRSDIYSLGVILYQMLTGRVPFTAESPVAVSLKHIQATPTSPRELNSAIPESVEEVILKAMAKDPNERYQEAQALYVAYWKAIQKVPANAPIHADAQSSEQDISAEISGASAFEDGDSIPATETCVLPEEERAWVHPPATPQLFPIKEEAHPTVEKAVLASSPDALKMAQGRHIYRSVLISLICLLLLMPIIGVGFAWQHSSSLKPLSNAQSLTAQQQEVDLTATAAAQAEARIQATLAAESRAQATAGITSSIGAGNVLYANTMLSSGGSNGGWIDDGRQCYFSPYGYHVRTFSQHIVAWCYSSQQQFSNIVITAQAQLLHGDIYGLIFRLSPGSRQFYVFELNSQGYYRFVLASGSNPLDWLTLIDWTYSSAILSGYGQINTILVVANGSHFRFYVNKQLVVNNFVDGSYSAGLIGFLVGGDSAGGTEAVFSDVWVFEK